MLDTLHRWTGGLVGLILALLGLSGAILVHRDAWIMLPHAGDVRVTDPVAIGMAVERIMADPERRPRSILFASDHFGLDRLTFGKGADAYTDQTGSVITQWDSQWQRPELWLFDFHHHLFAGDAGETVIGVAALCGLFFVISGVILWWRTRRTFAFRLWPRRMSRSAIVCHHRDLGVLLTPLLAMALFTGAVFVFRPVASLILGPGISAELKAAQKSPKPRGTELAEHPDWRGMVLAAHSRFPQAELRSIGLPRENSGLIAFRMRQPEEWLPNGRTMVWFAADTGALAGMRDSRAMTRRVKIYNLFYPLHAAKVGGMAYRIVMTLTGLALAMLGSLAVWSFWFAGGRRSTMPKRQVWRS